MGRVPGVHTRTRELLEALGITTVRDLVTHYPHQDRYRDVGELTTVADAVVGRAVTIVGTIRSWHVERARSRRMTIARASVVDGDGTSVDVPFFNQPWWPKKAPQGTQVAVSGVLQRYRKRLQLKNPKLVEFDPGDAASLEDGRIQPTYPATEGLSSGKLASLVGAALEALPEIEDHLPEVMRAQRGLMSLDAALRAIHRPASEDEAAHARNRLVYDELLCLQIGLQQRRHRLESSVVGLAQAPRTDGRAAALLDTLPFPLTDAQERATAGIGQDLASRKPMHRLLQGDVGSGKTVVAAWTMLTSVDHSRQAVLMAPTEVLAEQHFRTFTGLLAPLGVNVLDGPRVELLTGSMPVSRRRGLLAELAVGAIDILIGTHALLEEVVEFDDLGVVVVDEQHRFGVEHRTRLRDKRRDGHAPDVLVMTATPIPRSLALTFYGDLDVTVLDELPPGRTPVRTHVLASESSRRANLYRFVRERATAGERTYVVCPLVEESEDLPAASATKMHAELSQGVFSDLEVGLVHGRMPTADKDAVMEAFRRGDVQVLVATTVIEVGVDVPEATIMIIEDAQRFGISQLHQLRGRVGRGAGASHCVLFASEEDDNTRLDALAATTDGFRLAEVDLELRGEGSLFDTRQSGLPDLTLARLVRDVEWVAASREDARALVAADPDLIHHPRLADEVRRRYGDERLAALESG